MTAYVSNKLSWAQQNLGAQKIIGTLTAPKCLWAWHKV